MNKPTINLDDKSNNSLDTRVKCFLLPFEPKTCECSRPLVEVTVSFKGYAVKGHLCTKCKTVYLSYKNCSYHLDKPLLYNSIVNNDSIKTISERCHEDWEIAKGVTFQNSYIKIKIVGDTPRRINKYGVPEIIEKQNRVNYIDVFYYYDIVKHLFYIEVKEFEKICLTENFLDRIVNADRAKKIIDKSVEDIDELKKRKIDELKDIERQIEKLRHREKKLREEIEHLDSTIKYDILSTTKPLGTLPKQRKRGLFS